MYRILKKYIGMFRKAMKCIVNIRMYGNRNALEYIGICTYILDNIQI